MILNIKTKTLFQLGKYPFNTIIQILEDEKFEDVINPEYLLFNGNKLNYLEEDKLDNFCHNNTIIDSTKYLGLGLVHDYAIEDNTIINYNFIQKIHKLKQENFYEYIKSDNFLCFVTFLFDTNKMDLQYEKMKNILSEKYNIKDFVIVIFTDDKTPILFDIPKCYEIITIDEYKDDFARPTDYRINLYKDIWEKFSCVLKKYGYNYETFEELFDITRMPII
jgi:hypothetical protein